MNLFTSSFKSSLKKIADFGSVALILFLLEATLHIQENRWFDEVNAGDFRSDVIEESIKKAARNPEIAVIGSSVTSVIDTERLSKLTNESAERFVLYSANPLGTRRIFEEVILTEYKPKTLVYVTSPRDWSLDENIDQLNKSMPELDLYVENPLKYSIYRWIQNNFYIIRYRQHLKQPLTYKVNKKAEAPLQNSEKSSEEVSPKFKNFSYDVDNLAEVKHIASKCSELDIQFMIVILPTNPDINVTSDEFKTSVDSWQFTLENMSRNFSDLKIIDLSIALNNSSFYRDTHHANDLGSKIATTLISDQISD